MNSALRAHREEEGFTLIELLVVVIIIGILAAIAIPAFLNQRERAWQSELTSTVRNVALEVEAEATSQGGEYLGGAFPVIADLEQFVDDEVLELQGAAAQPVILSATDLTLNGFQMCGSHVQIDGNEDGVVGDNDNRVIYDSDGQQGAGLGPVTSTGVQDFEEGVGC